MIKFSTGEVIAALVLGVVFAGLGYWLSENDRRRFGRTPWGLPSGVWALFWFLSILLGLVLYLIAHSDVVRRARRSPDGRLTGSPGRRGIATGVVPVPPSASDQFPAYPRPANGPVGPQPAGGRVGEMPVQNSDPGSASVTQATTQPESHSAESAVSPPAWHPDPGGRFHYRWWDGNQWTSYVSFNGQQLMDTSPDQRIGPY